MKESVGMKKISGKNLLLVMMFILVFSDSESSNHTSIETVNPNIIYILADDLGYGDLSCFNDNSKIRSVNIDRLAESGIRFLDAHSGSSVCTPTRYGILTGRYSWRTRLQKGVLEGYSEPLIESERETVASFLKINGYSTGCIGKWHLGWDWGLKEEYLNSPPEKIVFDHVDFSKPIKNGPNDLGFDYFYGISASLDMGPYIYIENEKAVELPTEVFSGYTGYEFARQGRISPEFDHRSCLKELTKKAVAFIDQSINQSKSKPFFLYFPLTAPHTPIIPETEFQGKSGIGPYGDFVLQCDWTVGEIYKAVKKNGIENNTLIIFTSDNGASPQADFKHLDSLGHDPSYIFRGYKSDIYEGGHRIPFIASWPGVIPANSLSNDLICLTDLFATSAEIIGKELNYDIAEDSFSFLSALKNSKTEPLRKTVVHHSIDGLFSLRKGKWKIALTPGSGGWSHPRNFEAFNLELPMIQLYDLEQDIGETKNLMDQYPEVVNELIDILQKQVNNGRTTIGQKLNNDAAVNVWKYLDNRRSSIKLEKIEHSAIAAESRIINTASVKYSTNGIKVLTDGIRGTENYHDGLWAGIEGEDLEIELSLSKKQNIKDIKLGCLENQGSWIFFPKAFRIYAKSPQGKYELLGSLLIDEPRKNEIIERKDFIVNIDEYFTDHLQLRIESIKTCPQWHAGNGNKAWIFIDEIIVE